LLQLSIFESRTHAAAEDETHISGLTNIGVGDAMSCALGLGDLHCQWAFDTLFIGRGQLDAITIGQASLKAVL
jgi:hypothetical protein